VQSPTLGHNAPVIPNKVPASTAGWPGLFLVSQNKTKPHTSQTGKQRLKAERFFFYFPISFIDLRGKRSTGANKEPSG